ncbi:hypothetical protein FPQ18DRAFT_411677 [Pyronema domesticum]|nr:hypothetical protein FPQ18DRAFT_411677 [Pyronema domesticum]
MRFFRRSPSPSSESRERQGAPATPRRPTSTAIQPRFPHFRRSPSPSTESREPQGAPSAPRTPPSRSTQPRFPHFRRSSLPSTELRQPPQGAPSAMRTSASASAQSRSPSRTQGAQGAPAARPTFASTFNQGAQGTQGVQVPGGSPRSAMLSSVPLPSNYTTRMITLLDANIDSQIHKIQLYLIARNRSIITGRRVAQPEVPRIIWPNDEMHEAIMRLQYEEVPRGAQGARGSQGGQPQGNQAQRQSQGYQPHQSVALQGNQAQVHPRGNASVRQLSPLTVQGMVFQRSRGSDNRGVLLSPGGSWAAILSQGPSLGQRPQQENQPTRQTNHQAQGSGMNQASQDQRYSLETRMQKRERSVRWIAWIELMKEWTGPHRLDELTQLCNDVVVANPESVGDGRTE